MKIELSDNITVEPLRLRYTQGRGRVNKGKGKEHVGGRGSYITKCIRNQDKRKTKNQKVLKESKRK